MKSLVVPEGGTQVAPADKVNVGASAVTGVPVGT